MFERSELTGTLQRISIPSFIVAADGTITWVNDAARAIVGDVAGRPFSDFVAPDEVPLVQQQLRRKLEGAPVTDYQVHLLLPDGTRTRAEISSVPIAGGDMCHAVFGVAVPIEADDALAPLPTLTPRQNEVLKLLDEGRSTDDIAQTLGLSKQTVRNYIRQVLQALGARSRLEAVALARRRRPRASPA
jgi:PAS domain S-box-containing protein